MIRKRSEWRLFAPKEGWQAKLNLRDAYSSLDDICHMAHQSALQDGELLAVPHWDDASERLVDS
ncbi:MAG: hypothetical protein R3C14_32895 [Caldilineaceae bacterium]